MAGKTITFGEVVVISNPFKQDKYLVQVGNFAPPEYFKGKIVDRTSYADNMGVTKIAYKLEGHRWWVSPECITNEPKIKRNLPAWF